MPEKMEFASNFLFGGFFLTVSCTSPRGSQPPCCKAAQQRDACAWALIESTKACQKPQGWAASRPCSPQLWDACSPARHLDSSHVRDLELEASSLAGPRHRKSINSTWFCQSWQLTSTWRQIWPQRILSKDTWAYNFLLPRVRCYNNQKKMSGT